MIEKIEITNFLKLLLGARQKKSQAPHKMHSTLKSPEKTTRATNNQFRDLVAARISAAKAARMPTFVPPTEMDILATEAKAAAKAIRFAAWEMRKAKLKAAKKRAAGKHDK